MSFSPSSETIQTNGSSPIKGEAGSPRLAIKCDGPDAHASPKELQSTKFIEVSPKVDVYYTQIPYEVS